MHQLTSRSRLCRRRDDGFTLVELVVTVAILGIIVSALAGVVLAYLRTTVDSQARMTESHDVQFVSAYWQRDVASIGVRSTTYCQDATDPGCSAAFVHSYPLLQSINVTPSCTLPAGDPVATLAWTRYTATDPDHPKTVTVSYLATKPATRWVLTRVRCTDTTMDSTVKLADNLIDKPVLGCPGAASGCTGVGSDLPSIVTLTLTADDPADPETTDYTATLSGERRQS